MAKKTDNRYNYPQVPVVAELKCPETPKCKKLALPKVPKAGDRNEQRR